MQSEGRDSICPGQSSSSVQQEGGHNSILYLQKENGVACAQTIPCYALEAALVPVTHPSFLAKTVVRDCGALPDAVAPFDCPDHDTRIVPVAFSAVQFELSVVVPSPTDTTTQVSRVEESDVICSLATDITHNNLLSRFLFFGFRGKDARLGFPSLPNCGHISIYICILHIYTFFLLCSRCKK